MAEGLKAEDAGSEEGKRDDTDEMAALEQLAQVIEAQGVGDGEPPVGQLVASMLVRESYKGAFPHPRNLREFDEVVKDGAERAFCITEKEQAHRHKCDNKIIDAEIVSRNSADFDRRLVIICTMVLAFLGLVGTVVLAALGKNIPAGALGVASILAGGFGAYMGRSTKGGEGSK